MTFQNFCVTYTNYTVLTQDNVYFSDLKDVVKKSIAIFKDFSSTKTHSYYLVILSKFKRPFNNSTEINLLTLYEVYIYSKSHKHRPS